VDIIELVVEHDFAYIRWPVPGGSYLMIDFLCFRKHLGIKFLDDKSSA